MGAIVGVYETELLGCKLENCNCAEQTPSQTHTLLLINGLGIHPDLGNWEDIAVCTAMRSGVMRDGWLPHSKRTDITVTTDNVADEKNLNVSNK